MAPRWRRAATALFFLVCLALVSLALPLSPLGSSSSGLKPAPLLGRVYHGTENAAEAKGVGGVLLPVAVDGSSEEEEE